FIIHHVNLTDSDNFLGSSNLYDVAKRNNFWDGQSDFDFTVAYAEPFDADTSKITGRILTVHDIMRIQRDHYENTPFDLTQGPASGPYGNPARYGTGPNVTAPAWSNGQRTIFERPISYHTTAYSYVTSLHPTNDNLSLLWFGANVPHSTAYVPIYTKVSSVPALTSHGSLRRFDLNVSFWLNALIGNYAGHFYKHAMPAVVAVQLALEKSAADAQQEVQATAVSILAREGEAALVAHLTAASDKFATSAHEAFYALFVDVVTRFHDGSIFSDFASESMTVSAMGYPSWWLEEVGYFGPKAANGVAVTGTLVLGVVTVAALAVGLGFWLGRRTSTVKSKGYVLVK
ncbi:hypothetical protein DYB30_014287, partial [Aphanomyces astaci]